MSTSDMRSRMPAAVEAPLIRGGVRCCQQSSSIVPVQVSFVSVLTNVFMVRFLSQQYERRTYKHTPSQHSKHTHRHRHASHLRSCKRHTQTQTFHIRARIRYSVLSHEHTLRATRHRCMHTCACVALHSHTRFTVDD